MPSTWWERHFGHVRGARCVAHIPYGRASGLPPRFSGHSECVRLMFSFSGGKFFPFVTRFDTRRRTTGMSFLVMMTRGRSPKTKMAISIRKKSEIWAQSRFNTRASATFVIPPTDMGADRPDPCIADLVPRLPIRRRRESKINLLRTDSFMAAAESGRQDCTLAGHSGGSQSHGALVHRERSAESEGLPELAWRDRMAER